MSSELRRKIIDGTKSNLINVTADVDLPSYVINRRRLNSYNKVHNAYNWKPENTRRLRASLGKAQAGIGGVQHYFVIGDSIPAGYMGSTATTVWEPTAAWPRTYRAALAAQGVPVAGTGLVPTSDQSQLAADSRWTASASGFGASGVGYAGSSVNASTMTFTSDTPGTQVDVYYYGAGGAFTVNIDGLGAVTPTAGGSITPMKYTVTGLANTTHTVVITASNTTTRYIIGASVSGATTGLIIHNLALGSSQTSSWTSVTAGSINNARVAGLALSSITPAVVFIELGANDFLNSVSGTTFKTNMTTLRNQFSTSDVILVGAPCWSSLGEEHLDLADSLDIPFIDSFSRYGGAAVANGLFQDASNVHPNQALHADWGRNIAALAVGTGSRPDVVTLADTQTLTNKTINLASNTVTMTTAQLNAAVSDADVATLLGTEVLANKFLRDDAVVLFDGADATKQAFLNVPAAQTTSTTRTHTLPAVDSTLVGADANGNVAADGFLPNSTSTPTATGTTTLTVDSTEVQIFTGTTLGQVCVLPTTSITAGREFTIINDTTGNFVTLNASDGSNICLVYPGQRQIVKAAKATPTTYLHWIVLVDNSSNQSVNNKSLGTGNNVSLLDIGLTVYRNAGALERAQLAVPAAQADNTLAIHTLPAVDSTLASLAGTEVFTNKDLSSATNVIPARGSWTPSHYGYIAWTFDSDSIGTGLLLIGGVLYLTGIEIPYATTITNLIMGVQAAGSGLTSGQSFAGLYNSTGTLLSGTADQSTAWQSTGKKTMALSSAQAVSAGLYHIGLYSVGATKPSMFMHVSGVYSQGTALINDGLNRHGIADTGLTTALPSPRTTFAVNATPLWGAVS